jgi:hypothetical protein
MPAQAERRIGLSRRNYFPGSRRGFSAVDRALLAASLLTLTSIVGIVAYKVPNESSPPASNQSAEPTYNELQKPGQASQRVFYSGNNVPEVLIAALVEPESRLLSEMQDAFHRNGNLLKDWSNCSSDQSRPNRVFSNPATKRIAPFQESRALREIEAGEPFKAAIEVVVTNLRRKDLNDIWMAEIVSGGAINWAVREQKYRQSVLKEFAFSTGGTCAPFELPFDYTKDAPRGPIQRIK